MLSQSVGYAITALGYLASIYDRPALVRDVAEAMHIPTPYLAKIIHALARKGFVVTQRGIGGGVTLARKPEQITLLDVCLALDEPSVQKRCMLGNAICSDERACPAHAFWTHQREQQIAFLKRTTLQDMAEFEARQTEQRAYPGDAEAKRGLMGDAI
jgi:Rrf2 family protein